VGAEGGEQVGGLPELESGLRGDPLGRPRPEVGVGVEAGADGGAADGQVAGPGVRLPDAAEGEIELRHPPADDLAEGDGRGVLEVGAADHDDVGVVGRLGGQGGAEASEGRVEPVVEFADDRDVHGGGEGVVGGLAAVHVVVGVDGGLAAEDAPGQLDGPVADHLVGVHVRLGARPGLEHDQREMVVEASGDDLVGGPDDQAGHLGRQLPEVGVGLRCGLLQDAEGADHRASPDEGVAADVEVRDRTLGLGPPVAVGRHGDGTHRIGLEAGLALHGSG